MNLQSIIQHTMQVVSKLPIEKAQEVSDFADFILKKQEEELLQKGIQQIASTGKPYAFLKDEEDLYTLNDLQEKYK
jgi:hypothetical protein